MTLFGKLLLAVLLAWPVAAMTQGTDESDTEELGARLTAVEAQRLLALPLPPGSGKPQQIDYWLQRQRAAYTLGLGPVRLEALRKLTELTTEPGKPSPYKAYWWHEEWRYGNQTRALEIGEELVDDKTINPMSRVSHIADLGAQYLNLGDRSKASSLLERADRENKQLATQVSAADPGAQSYRIASIERLRARILLAGGDSEGASAAMRRSLDVSRAEVERARKAAGNPAGNVLYDRALRTRNASMTSAITLYFQQGRNAEAEAIARQGLKLAEDERTAGGTVGFWQGRLAQAFLGQRRYAETVETARQGIASLKQSGALPSSERVQLTQGFELQGLFGLERWAEADQLARDMREDAAGDDVARSRTDNPNLVSFLHLKAGRVAQAKERIDGSVKYRMRYYGANNFATIEARAIRAMVLQADGNTREALQDYDALFKFIFAPESSQGDVSPSGLRGYFFPQALKSYLALVAAEARRLGGNIDASLADGAFRVADRLQASAVQQSLIDSAARVRAGTPELAALLRKEQDQRIAMRDLLGGITAQLEEDRKLRDAAKKEFEEKKDQAKGKADREAARARAAEIEKARERIADLDRERAAMQLEVVKRFPAYQALVNPKPPSLQDLAKVLDRDEAFVSILPGPEGTFVWGVTGAGTIAFHLSPLKQSDIAALVAKLRATLDLGERGTSGTPYDAASAYRLYSELLAPIWPRLGNPRVATFAGSSELGRIPFAALVTKPPTGDAATTAWLVRDVAINQVATAAAFKALRDAQRPTRPASAFFGFGDPQFRAGAKAAPGAVRVLATGLAAGNASFDTRFDYGSIPALPETREEILALAKALGADPVKDVRLGTAATRKAALETPLADRRVLAFATHGLVPGEIPGLSRPALAMAAGAPDESPLLLLDDVLTLKLAADWVVLSACNTASGDGRAQEAFSGLARGFFFAGARSVLATHWAVETVSAQQLVTRTFTHHAANPSAPRAESLRQAQLELLEGKAGAQYRHPFYWAPYALYGDPTR